MELNVLYWNRLKSLLHDHAITWKHIFCITGLCWFPSQRAGNAELLIFCCLPEQAVEQIVDLPMIWDSMVLMWCCSNIMIFKWIFECFEPSYYEFQSGLFEMQLSGPLVALKVVPVWTTKLCKLLWHFNLPLFAFRIESGIRNLYSI